MLFPHKEQAPGKAIYNLRNLVENRESVFSGGWCDALGTDCGGPWKCAVDTGGFVSIW